MEDKLPVEITQYLPRGHKSGSGAWYVLPSENSGSYQGIDNLNQWLREQEWFPKELNSIIWFGDDGVGNLLGWVPSDSSVVLWCSEDGAEYWHKGDLESVWQFIENGYE